MKSLVFPGHKVHNDANVDWMSAGMEDGGGVVVRAAFTKRCT